jgi:AcrR family transcriptional regulator/predicted DNA-binding transcriptional regulator AlpA
VGQASKRRASAGEEGPRGAARYRLGDLVALTGVPASTIHHYLSHGQLPPPERRSSNAFVYDDRHVAALRAIRSRRLRGRAEAPAARTRLVDAAIAAFSRDGYQHVSVRSLCARAGVAKGTFYRYFQDKDALFLTAVTEVVDRTVDGFVADVGVGGEQQPCFERRLQESLPLLFELGRRALQGSGPAVHAAVEVFVRLVERLGRATDTDDEDPARVGGVLVLTTLIDIFTRVVEANDSSRPAT